MFHYAETSNHHYITIQANISQESLTMLDIAGIHTFAMFHDFWHGSKTFITKPTSKKRIFNIYFEPGNENDLPNGKSPPATI